MIESIYTNQEFIKIFNQGKNLVSINGYLFIQSKNTIRTPNLVQKYNVERIKELVCSLEKFSYWEIKVSLTDTCFKHFATSNLSIIPKINYRINIDGWSIEKLVSAKSRSNFRRSLKTNKVLISNNFDPDTLKLLEDSSAKFKVQELINQQNLELLFDYFDCFVFKSTELGSDKVNGFGFFLLHHSTLYYLWGGGQVQVIILKAIEYCKKENIQTLDFEGSSIPGVEKFYSSYEPELERYALISKNNRFTHKIFSKLLTKMS